MTELSRKADFALTELTSNGGVLNPDQNDTFIRLLIDQPTLLRSVRTVPMNTPNNMPPAKMITIAPGIPVAIASIRWSPASCRSW